MELYTLFLVFGAMRKAFGGWGDYKKLWNTKKGRFGEVIWGTPNPELADRIRSVSLRRTRAEVLPELPAKTYQRVPSEAGARLTKRLDDLQDDLGEELDEYERSSEVIPPAKVLTKLVEDTRLRVELARAKMADMHAWIERNSSEEDESPLVVFSTHRGPVEECGKLKGWRIITGDVTPKVRHDIVSEFQAGKLRGVALTLQSGGTGLTLTASHRMLFVDRAYTPPDNWQGEDRLCRPGQTQPVIISRLVTDHPLEIRLDEILEAKSLMIQAAMGTVGTVIPGGGLPR
jgi:SNF2 family DNA or RNA helicase